MPTANLINRLAVTLGSESLRIDRETVSTSATNKIDRNRNCVGATSPTPVTLFQSSTDGTPVHLTIIVDPDNLQATAKAVEIEITVGSTVVVFKMDRSSCLQLPGITAGEGAFGGSAAAGSISLIRARNLPGTTAGTDDVRVRCLALLA